MSNRTQADVDDLYLKSLEDRLQRLRDPNAPNNTKTSTFLSDLRSAKDQQLFRLLTSDSEVRTLVEDLAADQSIEPNWLRRKVAPQTCAINVEERKKLVKFDNLESQIRQQLVESMGEVLEREIEEEKKDFRPGNSTTVELKFPNHTDDPSPSSSLKSISLLTFNN